MNKLKAIWLLLTSKGFFLMADKGVASMLPLNRETMEEVQEEVVKFDDWLEDQINDLILQER